MFSEAIILAGGYGTRLQSVVSDVPKPMAPINQTPFLDYIFRYLKYYKIQHVVLSTGYLADKIQQYYKSEFLGIKISYAKEDTPLGTGGGIRLAIEQCVGDNVLVLNGDSFFDVNLNHFYQQHILLKADFSLALRNVENSARYGTILKNNLNRIQNFKEKTQKDEPGLINGGVYILERKLFLNNTVSTSVFSIEKDFFELKLNDLNIFGFEYSGYFIDIGIPEDYRKAQDDFKRFAY